MPTVLMLDVSLSMGRAINVPDSTSSFTRQQLAIHGINTLLDYMTTKFRLEFISLNLFASECQSVIPFTRDYDLIRNYLTKVENYGKTNVELAMESVRELIQDEWGGSTPCQVLLITDGRVLTSSDSARLNHLQAFRSREYHSGQGLQMSFHFPAKLHILCIENPNDSRASSSALYYQRLLDANGAEGHVMFPETPLSHKSVAQMFSKICETYFVPFHGELLCGHLSSHIQLYPPPEPYHKVKDFDVVDCTVSNTITICGFLDMNDVSSPASYSRHLVLPFGSKGDVDAGIKMDMDIQEEENVTGDDSKMPSFCVLLHGSLKVEGMVALCEVGNDWYGMLYSWADSKKKSNLMLTLFEPGLSSVPWLGQLNMFTIASDPKSSKKDDAGSYFPVKPSEKRSYTLNSVVWIRPAGLQADIQKLLRHARKLPEKTQNFYKELNRIRRAALSFGFYGLFDGLASILERECTLLPGTAHPDAALQLTHAANSIRSQQCKDFGIQIMPLRTKFNSDDA